MDYDLYVCIDVSITTSQSVGRCLQDALQGYDELTFGSFRNPGSSHLPKDHSR
jgi:hypothetical protein